MTDSKRIDLEADFPTDLDAELIAEPRAVGESGAAPVAEERADAQPVVVIEYRNRGISPILMLPLALLVLLAMFATYHYLVVRPRNQEIRMAAIRAGEVAASLSAKNEPAADDPKPGPLAGLPLPLTLESQPLPPGYQLPLPSFLAPPTAPGGGEAANPGGGEAPVEAVAEAAPAKPPLAVGFARPGDIRPAEAPPEAEAKADDAPKAPAEIALAPGPDIVAEAPEPPPADEPPPPTRDEMIQAIQNEAAAKADQRDEMLRRKEEARARVEAEAQQRVEDERTAFRRALYDIVTTGGPDAGAKIDDLCNQFGRNYSDDIRNRVTAALSRVHGRISRESEIRLLRAFAVPEPGILDFLANGIKISINARNGPRNPDEVRVIAAKQLLRSRPTITEADAARASSALPRYPGR